MTVLCICVYTHRVWDGNQYTSADRSFLKLKLSAESNMLFDATGENIAYVECTQMLNMVEVTGTH